MKKREITLPSIEELESELKRERQNHVYRHFFRNALYVLITVAAIASLVAILFMPVLKVYGSSMKPTVQEGELVVCIKDQTVDPGDVIAFYYNNKIYVKRVIAGPGSKVDIDEVGNVYVDDVLLDEPYLNTKSAGISDIDFPVKVPEDSYFVLGDNREASADSRNSVLGCIAREDLLGRVLFCAWPPSDIRAVH
ncbi:MAG: signal peptidase I [Oscillospiraceae bacterium]|nr:signal peptidase I [Oscillospiraceae bacterium]